MPLDSNDSWLSLWKEIGVFKNSLTRSSTVNVNEKSIKTAAMKLVQSYFRNARPKLKEQGLTEESLSLMDDLMQKILTLSNGNNPRTSYKSLIKEIITRKSDIDILKEKSISLLAEKKPEGLNDIEQKILETLRQILPSSALSYEQACKDLKDQSRISFRGVASEFRECLREVLDHLAPDKDVVSQKGFKLETDQKKPTMKQKVKFILAARGRTGNAIDAPEGAVDRVDESLAKLTRSVYNRSSISTHLSTSKSEVKHVQMYVESVLAELLEIHRG